MMPIDRTKFEQNRDRLRADFERLSKLTVMDTKSMHRDLMNMQSSHRKTMDDFRASMDQLRQSLTSMKFTMTPDMRRRNDEHNYRSHVFHLTFLSTCVLVGLGLGAWMFFR